MSAAASLVELRKKAEQHIVYPLNRDECLALIEIIEEACLVRDVSGRGMGVGWRRFDALVEKLSARMDKGREGG